MSAFQYFLFGLAVGTAFGLGLIILWQRESAGILAEGIKAKAEAEAKINGWKSYYEQEIAKARKAITDVKADLK